MKLTRFIGSTDSKTPSRTRVVIKPPKFWTKPVHVITIPQLSTRMPRYIDGRLNFLRRMLLGISKITYGMKTVQITVSIIFSSRVNSWNRVCAKMDDRLTDR